VSQVAGICPPEGPLIIPSPDEFSQKARTFPFAVSSMENLANFFAEAQTHAAI